MITLSIDGAPPASLPSLGITAATLELSNQGQDHLQLTLADETTLAAFPTYQTVRLYHDGTPRFLGWIDKPCISMSGEARKTTLLINGPWRWLDMTTYSDLMRLAQASGLPLSVISQIPWLNEGVDPVTGLVLKRTIREVLTAALSWVITKQGPVISHDLSAGTLDLELPWSEKQNVTVGSVVRDQLGWVPDHSVVWDYSTLIPQLLVMAPGTAVKQVTSTGIDVTQLSLAPRYDLLVNAVTLTYLGQPVAGIRPTIIDTSANLGDAHTLASPLTVEMTFALQKSEPLPAIGLAAAYHRSVARLAIDTSFTLLDDSLAWDCVPGQIWGFAGAAARWSDYTSCAQVITRDLFARTVTLKLGHPGHLGLQQLIDLHRKNIPQAGGNGGRIPPGQGGGGSPFELIIIETGSPQLRIVASTLVGGSSAELGFAAGDTPIKTLPLMVGVVYGCLSIDDTTGEITGRSLGIAPALPSDTDTDYYVEIGTVGAGANGALTPSQTRTGPITAQICRNWFAAESPYYGVTFG